MPEIRKCHECGVENPDQAFCGACGSPLTLGDYISAKVKAQLGDAIRDRDVLETESSIAVFKQAWSWIKLIFGIAVALLVLAGGGVIWKASDFWSGVESAKQSVAETARKSGREIARDSSQAKSDISKRLASGQAAIAKATADAVRRSRALRKATLQSRAELSKDTATFREELKSSRRELEAANKIQPEMRSMQEQLAQAVSDIKTQQKALSSSEEFAKSIFSSHITQFFRIGKSANGISAVIPPPPGGNRSVVFMLLRNVPIKGTLQLQVNVFSQPQNSYISVRNLVIFFWGDALERLRSWQVSVSYFPDNGQKDIIRGLSERNGRVFADGEPLPMFNRPDPDFKGDKWFGP